MIVLIRIFLWMKKLLLQDQIVFCMTKLAFRNKAPFTSCTSKINNTFIDNAEDLDVVMPMYNLFEYSKNYRNYYRDEPNSG